jgi:hypothetical protein
LLPFLEASPYLFILVVLVIVGGFWVLSQGQRQEGQEALSKRDNPKKGLV